MPQLSHAPDISAASRFVGLPVTDLVTPALVLDIDVANRNIETMAQWLAGQPARLRPHVKVHKVPQLAALQVRAGAVGVATATVWEARAMAEGGIEDVMIANEVLGERKAVSSEGAMPAVAGGQVATRFLAEEHMGIRLPADSTWARGDRVLVVAGYAPTTVNLYGVLFVSSRGMVVDAWPIRARHGTADAM